MRICEWLKNAAWPLCFLTVAMVANHAADLTLDFDGQVVLERAASVGLAATAPGAVVEWLAADGQKVRKGERLVVFSAEQAARELPLRLLDVEIARRAQALTRARAELELDALRDQQTRLSGELGLAEAAVAALISKRRDEAALAAAGHDAGVVALAAEVRAGARQRRLAALGQVAVDQVLRADAAVAAARARSAQSAAVVARLQALADTAARAEGADPVAANPEDDLELQAKRLAVRRLRAQLGVDEHGMTLPGAGIGARLAVTEKAGKRQRSVDQTEREQSERVAHEGERDHHDHTPLAWVSLTRNGEKSAVKTVLFLPAASAASAPLTDSGAVFTSARGFGWDVEVSDRLRAPATASPEHPGCILIREQRRWRIAVPDGVWQVRVGLGDALDWDGAVLWAQGGPSAKNGAVATAAADSEPQCLAAERRIEGGTYPEFAATVTVGGGVLELLVGDTCVRALRAPGDGLAVRQPWTRVGAKTGDPSWPVVFFVAQRDLTVRCRVPQEQVRFLYVPDALTAAGALPVANAPPAPSAEKSPLRTSTVSVHTRSGEHISGRIVRIDDQPAALGRAPLDWHQDETERLANELTIAVDDPQQRLAIGAPVVVRAALPVAAGAGAGAIAIVAPAHLVVERAHHRYAQVRGAAAAVMVQAERVGAQWLITGGLPATAEKSADLIEPQDLPTAPTATVCYAGEVSAGARAALTLPFFWGRIATLVPDGSEVTKGEVVATLYNPDLDTKRDEDRRARANASQAFLLSAEQRRVTAVQADSQAAEQRVGDQQAGLAWLQGAQVPVTPLAEAQAELSAAQARADEATTRLARFADLRADAPAEYAGLSLEHAQAAVAVRRAALALAAAARAPDWLDGQDQLDAWRAALRLRGDRDQAVALAQADERAAAMKARIALDRSREGEWKARLFAQIRALKAPASGRLFFATTWNDQSGKREKLAKDLVVWGGLTLGEVLDMSRLDFRAAVPERRYGTLAVGQRVTVVFAQFDGVRVQATLTAIGRAFNAPADTDSLDRHARVAAEREVSVTVALTVPAQLQDRLLPGTKGELDLSAVAAPAAAAATASAAAKRQP